MKQKPHVLNAKDPVIPLFEYMKTSGNPDMGLVFDLIYRQSPFGERLHYEQMDAHRSLLASLKSLLRPGQTLLSLGSGRGLLEEHLALQGITVTAVDISAVAIEQAQERTAAKSINITWVHSDAKTYAIEGTYDGIISIMALHWLKPQDRLPVLQKMMEHTKIDGMNLIEVVESDRFDSVDFHSEAREAYFAAGWSVDSFEGITTTGNGRSVIFAVNMPGVELIVTDMQSGLESGRY